MSWLDQFWIGPQGPAGPAGAAGAIGASNPVRVPLVSGRQLITGSTFVVVGGSAVDVSQYPPTYGTLNQTLYFCIDYQAAVGTDTISIQLYDATHGVTITGTTDSSSATTPPRSFVSSALTVGSAAGDIRNDVVAFYQVQAAVTAGLTSDNGIVYDAYLLVKYA